MILVVSLQVKSSIQNIAFLYFKNAFSLWRDISSQQIYIWNKFLQYINSDLFT